MSDPRQDRPKIIIDEDWKTQIEAEKEDLRKKESQRSGTTADDADPLNEEMPPASFSAHIMMLATQATAAMGQIPDPENPDQPPPVNLAFAKYLVDTIVVLEEKTRGNLSTDEAAMLENMLCQLRMLYVECSRTVSE